jgi:hypothetical protein
VTKALEVIEGLQYDMHSQISLTFPGEMWV